MSAQTISEKILSAKAGREVHAGDIAVCRADLVIGTDASAPMAIDYFERMGGDRLHDASRVMFAFDHYSPPTSASTRAFHERVRMFVQKYGGALHEVGEGINFQLAGELGRVLPGDLVIGADSHTVTCGAFNAFATGIGSSDLAAALITGQVWLRVPETIKVVLTGQRKDGVYAKDIALALVAIIGMEGANYQTLEFSGSALDDLTLEDRLVISNLGVEMDAKAAIFPFDSATELYLAPRTPERRSPVASDGEARFAREIALDVSTLPPQVARPHAPGNVAPIDAVVGTPVQMVFIGTCTGGRVPDFHDALQILERAGGHVADTVQLVLTPASREIETTLRNDGTLARFEAMGAIVTTNGCGACCGTSGVIPADNAVVLSTANRNFKARMGNATASIYLASPAACAAAAATGHITDPRVFVRASASRR